MNKLIPTEMIEDGMTLAESIKNKYGQIMLAEKVKLGSKQKKMLKLWGITSVVIVSNDDAQEQTFYNRDVIEKAKKMLAEKILWNVSNPFDEEIYQLALESILETHFS